MTKLLVVSDSSSLILAAKAKIIEIICAEFLVEIPKKVFEETVVAGKELQQADAFILEKAVNEKKIVVKNTIPSKSKEIAELIEIFNLDEGEKQAILLYLEKKAQLLLVDDKQAINSAKLLEINWLTVPGLLVEFAKRKKLEKKIALESLRILQEEGRYKLGFILKAFDEIEKEG
ncbi:MAG: hypothetical protein HYW50_02925 [Candidatus Diapherotrites archaeon]|nr:hypothetical protein [Candidatus Diapherotrites archaeon]